MTQGPDWVVLGSPSGGHPAGAFVIYASKNLTYGELSSRLIEEYDDDFRMIRPPQKETSLTVGLGEYMIIFGNSYGECWSRLNDQWTPEPEPLKEIDQGRKEITDGETA